MRQRLDSPSIPLIACRGGCAGTSAPARGVKIKDLCSVHGVGATAVFGSAGERRKASAHQPCPVHRFFSDLPCNVRSCSDWKARCKDSVLLLYHPEPCAPSTSTKNPQPHRVARQKRERQQSS
jgi:hypothetical protein